MTQKQWDEQWFSLYHELQNGAGLDAHTASERAHQQMLARYGPRPVGEPGPPLVAKVGALAVGVPLQMLNTIWTKLNGWKTIIGAAITLIAYVVGGIPLVAGLCTTTVCATTVAKVAGIGLTIVGLLHKGYKLIYREDHP